MNERWASKSISFRILTFTCISLSLSLFLRMPLKHVLLMYPVAGSNPFLLSIRITMANEKNITVYILHIAVVQMHLMQSKSIRYGTWLEITQYGLWETLKIQCITRPALNSRATWKAREINNCYNNLMEMHIFNVNNSSIIIYWTLKNLWNMGWRNLLCPHHKIDSKGVTKYACCFILMIKHESCFVCCTTNNDSHLTLTPNWLVIHLQRGYCPLDTNLRSTLFQLG